MSRDVLKLIAEETAGESFQANKLELDLEVDSVSRVEDEEPTLTNAKFGETERHDTKYISLKKTSEKISELGGQIFTYFLDGTRHVYKVDDISYLQSNNRKTVYPVVAGQIGVGCCRRSQKKMFAEKFHGEIVIALPKISNPSGSNGFLVALVNKINNIFQNKKINVKVSKILEYGDQIEDSKNKFTDRAVSKIQSHMHEAEQNMVAGLVKKNKLNQKNYLLKDGSLEYKLPEELIGDRKKILRFTKNYSYVVGVSKKFNPSLWTGGRNGKPNPGFIAELPMYSRTPVLCYENPSLHGEIKFAVWYLRLRKNFTDSPFDGVVKVEKILVTDKEIETGQIDSDTVDLLSAYLINERNPSCYGSDNRWANHIYPIFLTESFIKSKCLSAETFLNLF